MALDTPDFGECRTTGSPLLTDCGTTTSLGMSASAVSWRVRSTSPMSSFTLEFARLRISSSLSIGVFSSRSVWRPILTFLMFGMSMPATSITLSDTSTRPSTTSLKYAGVSTMTNEQNERSISTIATISAAPTWSANAGSSGAGITRRPDGSWVTSRLSSSGASIRSSTDTASTMVWCGVSFSMTATSPNCRSASTRHTGLSERWARVTASDGGQHRLAGTALRREHGEHLAVHLLELVDGAGPEPVPSVGASAAAAIAARSAVPRG